MYYNYRYYNSMIGRWIKRDPLGEASDVNLFSICKNNPLFSFDRLGLRGGNVEIYVYSFSGNDDIGYEGDGTKPGKSNEEIRKGETRDISGYGGFIVYAEGECCCDTGKWGSIKLVQLIRKNNTKPWKVDTSLDETNINDRLSNNQFIGYLDKSDPGRSYEKPGYIYGYIDAPGLGEKYNWLRGNYDMYFRVEAYCNCGTSDFYLNKAIEFRFTRSFWSRNGKLLELDRNPNPKSVYPGYSDEIPREKGYNLNFPF